MTLNVSATASAMTTTPAVIRTRRCCWSEGPDPLGDPAPGQREDQQRNRGADGEGDSERDRLEPICPVAPATVIAASTGPAQGT